ncbi:hypothetical protein AJ79_05317 [Helicocarpus griseus UAMH5409]|uniref:Zn(2)-C6 fungal-type domain-containing protein n=1 Tax=Helicocarpus griseus UAMH5409 TaxID=1447875 RepID=A0A2B7XNJ0_9EURO|nr:hypothetical protein AJ79_05317 [Helicocarpus griseus UAMH5409]
MEASQKRRSRSGCTECRTRHRKCDEARSRCSSCARTGNKCSYEVRLSWGGRPFQKSRFGDCLRKDPGLTRVPVASSSAASRRAFVYGSGTGAVSQQGLLQETVPVHLDGKETSFLPVTEFRTSGENQIIRNPDPLNWLRPAYRSLLDHFTSSTTRALSCHKVVQQDFCSVLIPMALQTRHLLVAILSLAATHRVSLGLEQSWTELELLKTSSLNQLRTLLAHPKPHLDYAIVATTLTLCITDVVSHGRSPHSWRLHLQGAAAMISEHMKNIDYSADSLSFAASLLWRWYFSLETVSLLCGNIAVSPKAATRPQIRDIFEPDEIDELAGFPFSLAPIFSAISRLAVESDCEQEQSRIYDPHIFQDKLPNNSIVARCNQLISEIHSKLTTPHQPRFRPDVDSTLTSVHRSDFAALEQTYHHVALLQLYRRVLNLPSSSPLVQTSVAQIIQRILSMHFLDEACPGVAVLQPLFSAGCEAYQIEDRESIRGLLGRMETRYGMGNVRSARAFLEELWSMRDANSDEEGTVRWDKVMGKCPFCFSPLDLSFFES